MESVIQNKSDTAERSAIINLTAVWAFSEGFIGGILNAAKIPFKGLILGGIAVIIITTIASVSGQRGIILRTGLIVIIIKAILSPYSSIAAYFAVFMQTILGELFFTKRKSITASAIALGIITSALSSLQRVIVATLIFGSMLWETIDQFTVYLYNEFFGGKEIPANFKFSQWLIIIYVSIHCIAGFLIGLFAVKISAKVISEKHAEEKFLKGLKFSHEPGITDRAPGRRSRIVKISKAAVYVFLLAALVLSYTTGDDYIDSKSVWVMLIRSVIITLLWFRIISPVLRYFLRKKLLKSKNKYSEDIQHILNILPFLKKLFPFAWKTSEGKGLKKLSAFVSIVLGAMLYSNFESEI